MNRETALQRLKAEAFDVLVIGGGATGLGCAVDAAARGHRTALIEGEDFAKATSSRSTKLIHGGVRYLQQGNISLVREALLERSRLRANAPSLVRELRFFVPARSLWDALYYRAGLRLYDALAGRSGFPPSRPVAGGVTFSDAQFDDARLAIALARTADNCGATLANYVRAERFFYDNHRICAVEARDAETQERFPISARVVVNATGIFADAVRKLDDPHAAQLLTFSRGSHIVVRGNPLNRDNTALVVPRTSDGRVVFAIPWYGRTLIGTTDVAAPAPELEPYATQAEVEYLIATINTYLEKPISAGDVSSAFAGLRPLIDRGAKTTARLSREHLVDVSRTGLVTIAGGKWTTYRKMAQDAIDAAERAADLAHLPCPTVNLRLHDDAAALGKMDEAQKITHYVWNEMARTLEDVLARRTRMLFIDAEAAAASAPRFAHLMAQALGRNDSWEQDQRHILVSLASRYSWK